MIDDDPPAKPPLLFEPRRLDGMSVAELDAYIAALRAEIARAETEIERKRHHRTAADAVFRPR